MRKRRQLRSTNAGGSQGVGPEYLVIIAGHQSNMVGGQVTANGGTIIAADDPDPSIYQYSPNGGGGSGDPAHALVLEQAVEPLRFPSGTPDTNVGPALTYAKAVLAQNPGKKIVIITSGVGGTNLTDWASGQSRFENFVRAPWDAFRAAFPSNVLHSVILSPMENEMQNGAVPATAYTSLLAVISAYRGLTGAANVPIYMGAAVPAYVSGNAAYPALLLLPAKAAVALPLLGLSGGLVGGSVGGDTVHYTNVANRTRGAWLGDQTGRTAALNNAPAPTVTVISALAQVVTFTSVGAPYYDVQWRAAGSSGAWTSTDFIPNQDNAPGQVFSLTMPGTGDRDVRIVAKAYGGDSTPSAVANYTAPVVAIPARTVELDFDTATDDGTNLISVPSIGTDTTAWTPISSAGSGALAVITKTTQNAHVVATPGATQRFRRTSFVFPAGNYSIATPIFLTASGGNGSVIGWGQASTNGDIYLTLTNTSMSMRHVTSGAQLAATVSLPLNHWYLPVWTYDRTANTGVLYLNGIAQTASGTLTQRSASPANSGGTDVNGLLALGGGNGISGAKWGNVMHWSQVLTLNEVGALMASLQTKYGITFG